MADAINNTLSTKYYWRDWLVVVYQEMRGNNLHYWETCPVNKVFVEYLHWKNIYNVLVSSVDKTKAEINHHSLSGRNWYKAKVIRSPPVYLDAKGIYNNLPAQVKSCQYMIRGVVMDYFRRIGSIEIRAPGRRKNYFTEKYCKEREVPFMRDCFFGEWVYYFFALG